MTRCASRDRSTSGEPDRVCDLPDGHPGDHGHSTGNGRFLWAKNDPEDIERPTSSATTTPLERATLRAEAKDGTRFGGNSATVPARLLLRLLDEHDATLEELRTLRAEVERLRSQGEIIGARFVISHAPKGVTGGPWESDFGPDGTPTPDLCYAISWGSRIEAARWIVDSDKMPPGAHVVRLVTRRKKAKK